MLAPEEQEEEEEKCWLQKKKKKKKKKKNGGGGDADDDDGGDFSQFYIYKLPIDRLSGCYWYTNDDDNDDGDGGYHNDVDEINKGEPKAPRDGEDSSQPVE